MQSKLTYEIEWREILLKRLNNARGQLLKAKRAEDARRTEARLLLTGFANFEEAHEAYGWGSITAAQLDAIEAELADQDNAAGEAHRRLSDFIGNIAGEIKMLKNDPEYREEIIAEAHNLRKEKTK